MSWKQHHLARFLLVLAAAAEKARIPKEVLEHIIKRYKVVGQRLHHHLSQRGAC